MKKSLFAILLSVLAFAAFAPEAKANDPSWDLALSVDVAGKGGWTTCYTFARALQAKFSQAGGESHVVIYDWQDENHFSNRHAFLVYRDQAGRYWGMDNRAGQPRWLSGSTPTQWAQAWDHDKAVSVVADQTNPDLAGQSPDASKLIAAL